MDDDANFMFVSPSLLVVANEITLIKLLDVLAESPYVRTLRLEARIYMAAEYKLTKVLPPVRKIWIGKSAGAAAVAIHFLLRTFAFTLTTIIGCGHRISLKRLSMPNLRYIKQECDYDVEFNGDNENEMIAWYPQLTHLYVKRYPFWLPWVDLETGWLHQGSYGWRFHVQILLNQRREMAAIVTYWVMKHFLGRDIASILAKSIMRISSGHWMYSKTEKQGNTVCFMYPTDEYKKLLQQNTELKIQRANLGAYKAELNRLEEKLETLKSNKEKSTFKVHCLESEIQEILKKF